MLLDNLLQNRLIILQILSRLNGQKIIMQLLQDIVRSRLPAAVQIDRTDNGFKSICKDGWTLTPTRHKLSMSKQEIVTQMEERRPLRKCRLTDDRSPGLGHFPLRQPWKMLKKIRAGSQLQHCITKKLQPFIMHDVLISCFIRIRCMRKCLMEQQEIRKRYIQSLRKLQQCLLPRGRQLHRHLHHFANFLIKRQALCPPKPNELEIAARTVFAFALFGT